MKFIPADSLEKLEFDKIRQLVSKEAYGLPASNQLLTMVPSSDFKQVMLMLNQVHECQEGILHNEKLPLGNYEDTLDLLGPLSIENYVLELEEILQIRNISFLAHNVLQYFNTSRKQTYPSLWLIAENIEKDDTIIHKFNRVFTPEGSIRSDASDALVSIRKKLGVKQAVLEKQFRFLLNNYKSKEYLADSSETIRNGRKVLCVLSEHKRKIRGIIHDESSTGRTAFIEPEEMIEINNDIFDLEQEERREIYKILVELCSYLSTVADMISDYQNMITQFDIVYSKAAFSVRYKGNKPKLLNKPCLNIRTGFHPLLLLKNNEASKITVPFTLHLEHNNRIIIISGPNAGGKSITLKSVGLLQMMVQAGLLVPVDKLSEFGIFSGLFTDIGDQQSIEDDLSTYSSRLRYIKEFLEIADNHSLAIIDEFGSGTDPQIGGAIAEAILRELHKKHSFAVVTTHYSNLKIYAFKTKGLVNASMHFDKELLKPSFELMVGKPGSSYAFEIAQKTGFSKELLEYARHKTGKNEKAVDEILADLQTELKHLNDKVNEIKDREIFLDKLMKNYNELQQDLEFRKKKFKLEQKEINLQKVAQETKNVEKILRELRDQKNVQKAESLALELRTHKKQLEQDISALEQDVVKELPESGKRKALVIGDFVRVKTGGAIGKLLSLDKEKAIVEMGEMKLSVKLKDLIGANEPLELNTQKSIRTSLLSGPEVESKIDLRGMRKEEAVKILEGFVDNALINNLHMLKILHGKGDGILKKAVWAKLKEYKDITKVYHPEDEFGGTGVTLVTL